MVLSGGGGKANRIAEQIRELSLRRMQSQDPRERLMLQVQVDALRQQLLGGR